MFVIHRSKYFKNRKLFGDWDIRVEQVRVYYLLELSDVIYAALADAWS